jgi:hypothetical protein
LTRDDALKIIDEYENKRPPSLDLFLDFVGLTEEEFMQISMGHMVSPYEHDPKTTKPGVKTRDFEQWSRVGSMPREEAEIQLKRWRDRQG